MTTFTQSVLQIVKNIPAGQIMTYGQVAARAGSPRAARAVGSILKANTSHEIPCHRVIRSDGKLGGYNGLRGEKARLLAQERE